MQQPQSKPDLPSERVQMRRGEILLWLVWALGTLQIAIKIVGPRLLLTYLYGWSKVQYEHLRILSMPKNGPWPLSNGEMLPDSHFVHYAISLVCWLVMFFASYPLVRLLLPRAKRAP